LSLGFVEHLDETEAAGTTGLPVGNDLGTRDLSVRLEHGVQIVGGGGPGQVPT
jgi:hypothetical protein